MLIRSLVLENAKSYDRATIDFTPGINAIVGQNGAGKTTILEAIGFALFGHLPYSQADFVREGAKTATVRVTFQSSHDERPYEVMRRCGSSSAYIVYDPELGLKRCEGRADVQRFLHDHLGVEPGTDLADLFANAVGVPQGTLTAAFRLTATQRKNVFDPLLRVEEYRKAYDNLRDPLNLLKDRQQGVREKIRGLESQVERLPGLEESRQGLASRIQDGESQLEQTEAELAQAEAARTALEEERRTIEALRNGVQQAELALASRESERARAQERVAEAEAARRIVETNRAGHTAYRAAQQEQRRLDAQVRERQRLLTKRADVDKRLSLARAQLDHQEAILAEIEQAERVVVELAGAVAQQEQWETDLRAAQRQVDRLHDAQAARDRTRTALEESKTRLAQIQEDIHTAQGVEEALRTARAEIDAHQARLTELRTSGARCEAEQEELTQQTAQIEDIEGALCPVCEQPLTADHRERLLTRNRERLAQLQSQWQDLQQRIDAAQKAYDRARRQRATYEQQLRALPRPEEAARVAATVEKLGQQLKEAQDRVAELATAAATVAEIRSALDALGNPRRRRDAAAQQATRRAQVEEKRARLGREVAAHTSELADLDTELASFPHLDADLARVAAALEEHQPADDLFRRHEAIAATLVTRQQEAEEAAHAVEDARHHLAQQRDALAAIESRFDETAYQEAVRRVDDLRGLRVRLGTDLHHWRAQACELEGEIAVLQERRAELDAARAQLQGLEAQRATLDHIRVVLKEAGPYVTKALVQHISYRAAQLFGEIMQDYTRRLIWNEDYAIVLEVDGRQRQFSQLSGGEQMSAALAVRLALLQEMSDIAVAFFDEPTSNLDETRREALVRQILAIDGFRQLFVISHDDTFEQATENLIRVRKVGGVSAVTNG